MQDGLKRSLMEESKRGLKRDEESRGFEVFIR